MPSATQNNKSPSGQKFNGSRKPKTPKNQRNRDSSILETSVRNGPGHSVLRSGVSQRIATVAPPGVQSFVNAGSEVSSKEVSLKITKYLDWSRSDADTLNVLNAVYDMEQDLLAPDGTNALGNNAVLSRVKRCRLSAYPRSSNAANAESVYAMLTSVPVRGGGGAALLNSHQQSVVVPPTFTPQWHKVFDCDYDKLFESAQVQPADKVNFPLFNTSVVDVDTFAPILGATKIQLKIEIWVAQTVPLRSQISLGTEYQADYVNSTATSSDQLAFVQVLGMTNVT